MLNHSELLLYRRQIYEYVNENFNILLLVLKKVKTYG